MPVYDDPPDGLLIAADALAAWTAAVCEAVGTPPDIAADVAEILVASDLRGIASHGTARLPQYVRLVEAGAMDPVARPVLERSRIAMVRFDARNGWGHHAGRVAIDEAISRARHAGSAVALVRNSNHFGIAGWYAMRAADAGLIGMSMTNSSPLVAPTRAMARMIGTNPIAVAVPAGRYGHVVLDMATSTVPIGRIEVAERRGEAILRQWAIGPDGLPANSLAEARAGALLPLGGEEATGGHKGYGLGLVVDMLTGVLAGASFGPNIQGLFSTEGPSDLGNFFQAIDPGALGDPSIFVERVESYLDLLTAAPTIPGAPGPVLYHGQPEAERAALQRQRGIVIDPGHHRALAELGDRLGLPLPEVRPRAGA